MFSLLFVLHLLGCADEDAERFASTSTGSAHMRDSDEPTPTAAEPQIERPDGWNEASHGRGAAADYARLFDGDEVRRIDIKMSAEDRQVMLDDMERLIGKLGEGRQSGQALDAKACEGKQDGDSCESADPKAGESACRKLATDRMFCVPKERMMSGAGARRGPLDLIGGDPIYVPVTVELDGERWQHVAMRYKGNSSLRGGWGSGNLKLGFRLNFDHFEQEQPAIQDQRFFGFSEMTFSSAYGDSTLIRDKLAAELAEDFGLVSARCAFYRVYVDVGAGPEYWGLYSMLEDPSDELLEEQFADAGGNMYKPDGPGAAFAEFDAESFAKKTNQEAADWSDVQAAFAALHAAREPADTWRKDLEARFDVDMFLKVLAFSRAIGHWDGYGVMSHNYYLYGDPMREGRLVWISWDHNLTWQAPTMGGGRDFRASMTVMMDEVKDSWPLIRYLLDDEVYRERYRAALEEFMQGAYEKQRFDARARELHALVAASAAEESPPFTSLPDQKAFDTSLSDPMRGLLGIADARRADVRDALSSTPPR